MEENISPGSQRSSEPWGNVGFEPCGIQHLAWKLSLSTAQNIRWSWVPNKMASRWAFVLPFNMNVNLFLQNTMPWDCHAAALVSPVTWRNKRRTRDKDEWRWKVGVKPPALGRTFCRGTKGKHFLAEHPLCQEYILAFLTRSKWNFTRNTKLRTKRNTCSWKYEIFHTKRVSSVQDNWT